jgi:hypothetical protein
MSIASLAGPSTTFLPVSQLTARELRWLWPGRLALGKLAMLDGDPGLGKSLVTLDLCARLSTGRPFPDGSPIDRPINSLVLNAEDDGQDTVRPRLQALGADLERVFLYHAPDGKAEDWPSIPGGLLGLHAALTRTQARLVIFDPVMAFLHPGVAINQDASVRQALLPLAQLAARHDCAMILVRHLNKSGRGRALYRGGGSVGLVAVCRSAWLIACDPLNHKRRVLAQVKNNLARPQPSLVYEVEAPTVGPATVSWLGTTPATADELLAATELAGPTLSARQRAHEFLLDVLQEGPMLSREIWPLAQEQRLSRRTLHRAREALKIKTEWVHVEGATRTYWLLPGQQLVRHVGPASATPDLDAYLETLQKHYPPPSPLDDL